MPKKERKSRFETLSGIELKAVYRPDDLPDFHLLPREVQEALMRTYKESLGDPGHYPFRRGIYPFGYRAQLPTLRQFSGQGLAPDTNERLHYLIGLGETGLSIAYDLVTLMGRDSDNEDWSLGYVGKDGVAVDTFADYEDMLAGIPSDRFAISETINFPAIVFFCMRLAKAKKEGVPFKKLRGTMQADILKEIISQKEYRFPLKHGMRLVGDMMEYCIGNLDLGFYPVSVSGYHMSEAGASSVQELAFTLKNGFTYLEYCALRNLDYNAVAARTSCFFNCKGFWEDVAKFRAARRIWAVTGMEKYGIKDPRALALKFHVQNSGVSFKRQEPRNNVIRGTLQCLAAYLGGAQSIHINSWDEEIALPSYEAVKEAVRTQQIVGEEMNITDVVDPLGGGYFIEALTAETERRALEYIRAIDEMGGMIKAVESGYPQLEIKNTSCKEAERFEKGELVVVGVNKYADDESSRREEKEIFEKMNRIPTMETHLRQKERIAKVKAGRDEGQVEASLRRLADEARGSGNLVEAVLEAVEAYATVEEMMIKTLEPVFGRWRGPGD